jgi:hypothetical protein
MTIGKRQVKCDGLCVSLNHDHWHCGACGRQCDSGQVCVPGLGDQGICATSCQPHRTNCGGDCVDLQTDHMNCGSCGRQCDSGQWCSSGFCSASCLHPLRLCMGRCVDYDTDRQNCGSCGRVCDAGEVCSGGFCAVSCQPHLNLVAGLCLDFQSDRRHCGGYGRECPAGQVCSSGFCFPSCGEPLTPCGNACVDTRHDPAHCGGCDRPCQPGQVCAGEAGCQDVGCQTPCPEGQTLCSGRCVDTGSDPFHCGDCGTVCALDESCAAGRCTAGAFRILSLDTQCWLVDDTAQIDAPRGPIAFGTGMLYYSGAALVLGYDFMGGYAVMRAPQAIPTLTSDLATGQLWALGDAAGLVQAAGATVTSLVPIHDGNSLEPGTALALSEGFVLTAGSGLFSGHGRIGVHTGDSLLLLDTSSGQLIRQASPALQAAACQGPFYSGVLEQHADGLRLAYVQAGTHAVVRSRPADGVSQVILQGIDFADMCGLAVDLHNGRWCFHLAEPSTQFDTQPGQSMAFCCQAAFRLEGL